MVKYPKIHECLMKVLVAGLGHVGNAILSLTSRKNDVDTIDVDSPMKSISPEVMHICYGYDDNFISETVRYIETYKPKLTIIESTVLVGTTKKIAEKTHIGIVHSPVVGRDSDDMANCLLSYTKYIGAPDGDTKWTLMAQQYYKRLGVTTKISTSSTETELAKLLETTYYGLMISWFQEIDRICDNLGASFDEVSEFIGRITDESKGKHMRPIFRPGFIGGHCVIPNAKILNMAYSSDFVDVVLRSNDKTKAKLEKSKLLAE